MAPVRDGQSGESRDLIDYASPHAGMFQIAAVETGQHGHRKDHWRSIAIARRIEGGMQHLATTSGVYVLPARDECIEALQWLAQETRQAGGDALLVRAAQFEGLSDTQLIASRGSGRLATGFPPNVLRTDQEGTITLPM